MKQKTAAVEESQRIMNKPLSEHPKLLLDPYLAWCDKEGAPIAEDFGIDLLAIPTAPWPRFGVDVAIAHLKGRGDALQRRRRVRASAARPQHVGDELHPRSLGLRAQDLDGARCRRLQHDVRAGRRHHACAHVTDAGRHLQEGSSPWP